MKKSNSHNNPAERPLSEWAPILASIPKDGEFRTPDDYFDIHEEEVMAETAYRMKCLRGEVPTPSLPEVSKAKKTHDGHGEQGEFYVPLDYFNSLSESIRFKIHEESWGSSGSSDSEGDEKKSSKIVSLFSRPKFIAWSAAAAMLLGLWYFTAPKENTCQSFACLLEQTQWSREDMMMLSEEDLESIITPESEDFSEEDLETDAYIDYLMESEIDIDELYNEIE